MEGIKNKLVGKKESETTSTAPTTAATDASSGVSGQHQHTHGHAHPHTHEHDVTGATKQQQKKQGKVDPVTGLEEVAQQKQVEGEDFVYGEAGEKKRDGSTAVGTSGEPEIEGTETDSKNVGGFIISNSKE